MKIKFCDFPDIHGFVSLCSAEIASLVCNIYLIVVTIAALLLSKTQKKRTSSRHSYHALTWILVLINSLGTVLYSTAWLLINTTQAVVIYQILNILTFICLPLAFYIFQNNFHAKYTSLLTVFCLLSGVSKMVTVTSFSRSMDLWEWFSEVDLRFVCAVVQAVALLFLTFITFYNIWHQITKRFIEVPNETSPGAPLKFLSKNLYLWCWDILVKARGRSLQLSDCLLFNSTDFDLSSEISSLLLLLLRQHWKSFLVSGILNVGVLALEFVPIYITYCVIRNFVSPAGHSDPAHFTLESIPHNSYSLIVILLLSEGVKCLWLHSHNFITSRIAAKSHFFVQRLVYNKILNLAQWEIGDVLIHLATVQVDQLTAGVQMLHQVWKIPLQFTMCIIFMEMLIGFSALLPIAVLIGCLLLVSWLLHKRATLESNLQISKQPWYCSIQEYVENIWILKIRNMQKIFKKKVLGQELGERKVMILFSVIQVLKHVLPTLLLLILFLLYHGVRDDWHISLQSGGAVILLLNMVRIQLSTAQTLCKQILLMAESLADIANTLELDEVEPPTQLDSVESRENNVVELDICEIQPSTSQMNEAEPPVLDLQEASGTEYIASITNATFAWETQRMSPKVLTDINLRIPQGKLTLILGQTGAGKTSLLSALLSEMYCMVGQVSWKPDTSVAVAAQHPEIFAGTVKENVLFGEEYEADRYLKIITLCNLKEHTLNIQEIKCNSYHPISLARALYSHAPVILLDEPLAALDTQSREQFFFESVLLFAGEEDRTVVMTTSDPRLVEHAHQVILLHEGKIEFAGTPSQLDKDNTVYLDLRASRASHSPPPPVPLRKRLEKNRVSDSVADDINVKNIPLSSYREWIQSCSTVKLSLLLIVLFCTAFLNAITYWLLLRWINGFNWTSEVESSKNVAVSQEFLEGEEDTNKAEQTKGIYYFLLAGGGQIVGEVITVILVNAVVGSACYTQLNDMLHSVASMSLFHYNKTALSSVLNRYTNSVVPSAVYRTYQCRVRFTVDLELIGRPLMDCLTAVLFLSSQIIGALVVQVIVSPGSLVVIIPVSLLTIGCYLYYKPACRVIRILQAEFKQNIYRHISETISCLTLVRGFGVREQYISVLNKQTHHLHNINIVWAGVLRWVSLYQDLSVNVLILGCFVATTLVSDKIRVELLALSLLLLLLSAHHSRLIWNLLDSCDVILSSVDNCVNLAYHTPFELDTPRFKPPADWPPKGAITFQDVFASMSADQEPQLCNITLTIQPGTKLGVGSSQNGGKNLIVPLMFRSLHLHNGDIKIDEWDSKALSLEDLRGSIGFVPTDPPLFQGTLRFNLDPSGKFEDEEIWAALGIVNLKDFVSNRQGALGCQEAHDLDRETRRLLYLSIMILNQYTIIVVEEPKIISDTSLHRIFTQVLDEDLRSVTRIVIGQRSDTLLSCQQVLLLNQGRIASFGSKQELEETDCPHYKTLRRVSRLVSSS